MTTFYTGVGSRLTPEEIQSLEIRFASVMRAHGLVLRSGHAKGSDRAFGAGAFDQAEIYLPWPGFGTRPYQDDRGMQILGRPIVMGDDPRAHQLLAQIHPGWASLSPPARRLHTRNVGEILGADLATPSRFVICYTPDGEVIGGTATVLRLAEQAGLIVINLGLRTGQAMAELAIAEPLTFFKWLAQTNPATEVAQVIHAVRGV